MIFKISEVLRVVSPAGGAFWVQVHDFTPEDEEEKNRRGRLVAILGVKGEEGSETMQMVELGREILSFLHEQYYGNLQEGVMDRLRKSLEAVWAEFGERVQMGVLVDTPEVLYAATGGGCRIFGREGQKDGFVGGEEGEKIRVFSLWKKTELTLVLGTAGFWEKFGEEKIKETVARETEIRQIAEELAVTVGSGEEGSGVGAVIVKLEEAGGEVIQEVETVEEPEEKRPKQPWKLPIPGFWPINKARRQDLGKVAYEKKDLRQRLAWGMVILIVTLVILGQIKSKIDLQGRRELEAKMTELEQTLIEIKLLVEVNPSRAREEAIKLNELIAIIEKSKNSKAVDLVAQAKEVQDQARGLIKIEPVEVFDLSLLREGMKAEILKKSDKGLVILDSAGGRLVSFDIGEEKGEVVLGGENMAGVRFVAVYPGLVYLAGSNGVRECVTSDWKCTSKISGTEMPAGMTDLSVWTGNLYVLDGQEGRVWKYQKTTGGFGPKSSWMDTSTGLVGSGNLMIDGQIWIATLEGGIAKYNRGIQENFSISGMENGGLGKIPYVYTSGDEERLYILDRENRRILVVKKTGEFEKQLSAEMLAEVTSLTVFEDKDKLYLSQGSKIYRVDLP